MPCINQTSCLSKDEFSLYQSTTSRKALAFAATAIVLSIISATSSALSLAAQPSSCDCSETDKKKKNASSVLTVISIVLSLLSVLNSGAGLVIQENNQTIREAIDPPKLARLC